VADSSARNVEDYHGRSTVAEFNSAIDGLPGQDGLAQEQCLANGLFLSRLRQADAVVPTGGGFSSDF
jgi:hypothetical protein